MEFHVSRQSRDTYKFDDALFSLRGNAIIVNAPAARRFAQSLTDAGKPASPGELNAIGLIDEISHALLAEYRAQINPAAMREALAALTAALGPTRVDDTLLAFAQDFPTVDVHRGRVTAGAWLAASTEDLPNREVALEEMLMLWLANVNPAFAKYAELFSDAALARDTAYREMLALLTHHFDAQPALIAGNTLISLLRAPALAHPDSVEQQLRFIEAHWLDALPALKQYQVRLLGGHDILAEESRGLAAFLGGGPGFLGMGTPEFNSGDILQSIRGGCAGWPGWWSSPGLYPARARTGVRSLYR